MNAQAKSFNKSAKQLDTFSTGQEVLVRNPSTHSWDSKAVVQGMRKDGRSYWVKDEEEFQTIRNRRDLRALP